MKRKVKSILKKTLEEEMAALKRIKRQEYEGISHKLMSQGELYQSLPPEEQSDLVRKMGLLALNVTSSINCALRKNKSSDRIFLYLEDIQKSDGSLETSFYWQLVKAKTIVDDQLSPKLIRILSNSYETRKQGLSSFKALPENIDEKPYKDHYLEFCINATKKIMREVLDVAKQKIDEEKEPEREGGSWVDMMKPDPKKSKHVSFAV